MLSLANIISKPAGDQLASRWQVGNSQTFGAQKAISPISGPQHFKLSTRIGPLILDGGGE